MNLKISLEFLKELQQIQNHKHYATFHSIDDALRARRRRTRQDAEVFKTQYKLNRYLNSVVEEVV